MVCFSLEGSHRVLLRIIHAFVFDAHHAVRNGVDKVRRRRLTLLLLPVPKARRRASSRTKTADKSAKTFSPINLESFDKVPFFYARGRAQLLATIMATRQRLRAVLDIRRASRLCWRCALNLSRYSSTSAAGIEESSESMKGILREKMVHDTITVIHDELMEQDIDYNSETVKPDTQSSSAEIATRRSDWSEGHSSQTVLEHLFDAEGMPFLRHVLTEGTPRFDSPLPTLRKTGVQNS